MVWRISLTPQPLPSTLLLLCSSSNMEGRGWHEASGRCVCVSSVYCVCVRVCVITVWLVSVCVCVTSNPHPFPTPSPPLPHPFPPPQNQYKGTATCFVCTASEGAGPVDLTNL